MDKLKSIFSRSMPLIVAVVTFFVVCAVCFAPQFEGRKIVMHDIQQFDGMSSDIRAHRAATGEDPQWTGAMFGGMSVIWELDSWRILKQTVVHFAVISVVTVPVAYITEWMHHSILGAIIYFSIFAFCYASVWICPTNRTE